MKKLVVFGVAILAMVGSAHAEIKLELEKRELSADGSCWYMDSDPRSRDTAVIDYVTGLSQGGALDVRVRSALQLKGGCGRYADVRHYSIGGTFYVYKIADLNSVTLDDLRKIRTVSKTISPLNNECWYVNDGAGKCREQAARINRGLSQAGAFDITVKCVRKVGSCGRYDNIEFYAVEGGYKVNTLDGVQVPNSVVMTIFEKAQEQK